MLDLVRFLTGLAADLLRTRSALVAESALLRQQLIVAKRKLTGRVRWVPWQRFTMGLAARIAPTWRSCTLLAPARDDPALAPTRLPALLALGVQAYGTAPPRIAADTIALIEQMATNNRLWCAERIRGELLKLDIHVAKRTIQKYMRRVAGPQPPGQRWATFLRTHAHETWACDFLQTYDLLFHPIFAFFVIAIGYFNSARPHQGIRQQVPDGPTTAVDVGRTIVEIPVLGGLHHGYRRAA
jgi:putative transposase